MDPLDHLEVGVDVFMENRNYHAAESLTLCCPTSEATCQADSHEGLKPEMLRWLLLSLR
jgi:hypothetical protein